MRRAIPVSVCFLVLLGTAAAEESLLTNGSFETVAPGKPGRDAGQGAWILAPDQQAPVGWLLNSAYPGTIAVVETNPSSGRRCLRMTAHGKRDAQIYRPCPGLRPGRWYRISVRVREGAAALLVYEYGAGGGVKAHTLASGSAPAGAWRTVTGFYAPAADGFRSASVALLVPRGRSAHLDDVVVEPLKGPAPDAKARPIRLANDEVRMVVSGLGRLDSLVVKGSRRNLADANAPMPILSVVRGGVRIPLSSLRKRGDTLVARFADPGITARIRVKAHPRYFLFEVTETRPKDLDRLEFRFPVRPLRVRDAWMPGTYDDTSGVCHMGVTPNTEVSLARYGGSVAPEARWTKRHGIRGGKSVLIATRADRFLEAIRRMEVDTGLPSPMLRSGAPGKTGTTDWARLSPALRQSYLFVTYLAPGDLDAVIRYAKAGGFGLIMLHRQSWRASAGHEEIARTVFPRGLPDLVETCRRIHAAGLGVGLHLFGPFVSLNDAYVRPVPDDRLFTIDVAPLAAPVDATATELVLERRPALPRRAAPGIYPGHLLRIGDEIVRWREMAPGPPCRLVGCERGALETKAAAHAAGAAVRSLALRHGMALVDPDSSLPQELGDHLARVVNAARVDLVYFDGIGAAPQGKEPEVWYYLNRVLLASCAKFDHGVIVQTGRGPGRQLAWHLVPRSASADGHGDLKGYLDQRLAGILQMRRTFTAADIGWYALDVHGRPDELEYVCAKSLATGSSVSVQAYKALLESHPRAREVFEMLARWERRRRADDIPAAVRPKLLAKGRDFRLLEEDQDPDRWTLWEAAYEPDRPIAALDGQANVWTVSNPSAHPVRMALEIRREAIATTPREHADERAIRVADFADLKGYGARDDRRLEEYIQIGGRKLTGDGLALRGVKTTLTASSDAPVGTRAAVFSADNPTNGAGWCGTGRRLAEPLDLTAARALGLWVHGDGHGETLALTLCDPAGRRARFRVTLDFEGWRFKSFPRRGPTDLDWARIEYLVFELNHIPPNAKVSVRLAALRAVPNRHEPRAVSGLTLTVGERKLHLPASLEPGRCITLDALGRCTAWPGGMAAGRRVEVEGGALILAPGTHRIVFTLDEPDGYAGDVSVRVCRSWPLTE